MIMAPIKRVVQAHPFNGYKEVALAFRKARSEALEKAKIGERTERICCPVLDAVRTEGVYGKCAMPTTDIEGIETFCDGFDFDSSKVKAFAYLTAPSYGILRNICSGSFDESEVNKGFLYYAKFGTHTGILEGFKFNQDKLDGFIWNIFPDLQGISIDYRFLTDTKDSSKADGLFISESNLEAIMAWNESQSCCKNKMSGPTISKAECGTLLLTKLGQQIQMDPKDESSSIWAISVRDFHDMFKYGVFPALIEDKLLAAGLIEEKCLGITASE